MLELNVNLLPNGRSQAVRTPKESELTGNEAVLRQEEGCRLVLEPVEEEEDLMERFHQSGDLETKGRIDILADMSRGDEDRLTSLLKNHVAYTDSARAKTILDNWAEYRTKVVKVMPVEYRRAIREMERGRILQADE